MGSSPLNSSCNRSGREQSCNAAFCAYIKRSQYCQLLHLTHSNMSLLKTQLFTRAYITAISIIPVIFSSTTMLGRDSRELQENAFKVYLDSLVASSSLLWLSNLPEACVSLTLLIPSFLHFVYVLIKEVQLPNLREESFCCSARHSPQAQRTVSLYFFHQSTYTKKEEIPQYVHIRLNNCPSPFRKASFPLLG